jgi:hypothetical protein
MKTVVRDSHWSINAVHITNKFPNGSVVNTAIGADVYLLRIVCQQMNVTMFLVPVPDGFEMETGLLQNLSRAMIAK